MEFGNVGFCVGRKTGVPGEKPLGARTRINNKLNPHKSYGVNTESRTRTTLVGGECSHHCAIPASVKCNQGYQLQQGWLMAEVWVRI